MTCPLSPAEESPPVTKYKIHSWLGLPLPNAPEVGVTIAESFPAKRNLCPNGVILDTILGSVATYALLGKSKAKSS